MIVPQVWGKMTKQASVSLKMNTLKIYSVTPPYMRGLKFCDPPKRGYLLKFCDNPNRFFSPLPAIVNDVSLTCKDRRTGDFVTPEKGKASYLLYILQFLVPESCSSETFYVLALITCMNNSAVFGLQCRLGNAISHLCPNFQKTLPF